MISPSDEVGATKPGGGRAPWPGARTSGLMLAVVLVACAGGLAMTLARAVQAAREAARRSTCVCNFCAITLALHNDHADFGSFPPAVVRDRGGRPLYSWRVLILPYREQRTLYDAFQRDEPWDSPLNLALLDQMPRTDLCPSRDSDRDIARGLTSYVAITGAGTVFPNDRCTRLEDIRDGTSNTLVAAETHGFDVPWTAPIDLNAATMSRRINARTPPGIASPHPGGANVAFADGSKRFLTNATTPAQVEAMLTIDAGELVGSSRADSK